MLMADHDWSSRNKTDLMIEVWEKLDCESVGRTEVEAIEVVVKEVFGEHACDPPVVIARLLADEGAVLRHSEILELDVRRRLSSPYGAMFREKVRFSNFDELEESIRYLEILRNRFDEESDEEGRRTLKEVVSGAREQAEELSRDRNLSGPEKAFYSEVAQWFSIWLQSSEIFSGWVLVRKSSPEFKARFGRDGD